MRIGADIGGTFTDVVMMNPDGRLVVQKTLSTPPAYEDGVISAVRRIVGELASTLTEVVHGTTIATNAVLERRGALTALVTTAGFRDVLELRRLRMPRMYDLFWRKPTPLVERWLRFEVDERMLADGTELKAVDHLECLSVAEALRSANVQSVAIALLHGHLYPDHEEEIARILRPQLPGVPITTSNSILREEGEYERTATAVVNAYVQPLMAHYLDNIVRGLHELGAPCRLTVMQSSGGLMTAEDAKSRPVLALESGPAAGVVAALSLAQSLGYSNVIAFDMGGTTAKASLIEDGLVDRGWEYEAGGELSAGSRLIRGSGELLRIPNIDIAEVGAGGGSVAWLDGAQGLQVGPKSAGALPGPACYGLGGEDCTVTDANVALGYIPAGDIADSAIRLSREAALKAVQGIADRLNLPTLVTARGIHDLANARMMRAVRSVSSERGRDPRSHVLLAYGGSGPVHAASLAEELGISTVLVPPHAGVFSAIGLLFARPEFHEVLACQIPLALAVPEEIESLFREMEQRILHTNPTTKIVEWRRSADLRYEGQSWQIETAVPPDPHPLNLIALGTDFETEHRKLYGVTPHDASRIEIRALRLVGLGESNAPDVMRFPSGDSQLPTDQTCIAFFHGLETQTRLLHRAAISERATPGPLLVKEYDTTVVVPPSWEVRRDTATNTLVLQRVKATS